MYKSVGGSRWEQEKVPSTGPNVGCATQREAPSKVRYPPCSFLPACILSLDYLGNHGLQGKACPALASRFPSYGPAGVRQVQQKPANHLLPEVSPSRGGAANLVVNHCTCTASGTWHLAPAPVLAPCPGPRPYLPTPPDATLPGHLPAHPVCVCGLGHRCVPSFTCVLSFKLRLRPPTSLLCSSPQLPAVYHISHHSRNFDSLTQAFPSAPSVSVLRIDTLPSHSQYHHQSK